jgi:hypothetical protein
MNDDRPLPDSRDQEEKAAVAAALEGLPKDHPARQAHEAGLDTIRISHLVADQPAIVERLKVVRLEAFGRTIGGHFKLAPGGYASPKA